MICKPTVDIYNSSAKNCALPPLIRGVVGVSNGDSFSNYSSNTFNNCINIVNCWNMNSVGWNNAVVVTFYTNGAFTNSSPSNLALNVALNIQGLNFANNQAGSGAALSNCKGNYAFSLWRSEVAIHVSAFGINGIGIGACNVVSPNYQGNAYQCWNSSNIANCNNSGCNTPTNISIPCFGSDSEVPVGFLPPQPINLPIPAGNMANSAFHIYGNTPNGDSISTAFFMIIGGHC